MQTGRVKAGLPQAWETLASSSSACCTGLTHLDFCSLSRRRDEDITNVGIAPLAGMTNLCSLNLAGHPEITAEALAFLADCTSLSRLDLSGRLLPVCADLNPQP